MRISLQLNRNSIKRILYLEFLFVFFYSGIVDLLNIPRTVTYVIDLMNVIVFIFLIYAKQTRRELIQSKLKGLVCLMVMLLIVSIISATINFVSPLLFLWGIRNALRFYPFLIALIVFWDRELVEHITQLFIRMQVFNFIIVLVQFFVLGYSQDNLGGIFGVTVGCNGAVNIYMCIVVTLIVVRYLRKKCSLVMMIFTSISWLIICALTELKVGFIEIPLIIVLAILFNKPTFKSVFIVGVAGVGLGIGIDLIVKYFPEWANAFTSIESLLSVGSHVGGGYNISRMGAFRDINQLFFHDSLNLNLFGLGMGNCEYSSFSFLTSEFYKIHGGLNYRWFSHQMWFLQCGYVAIILLAMMVIYMFIWISINKHRYEDDCGYGAFGQIFLAMSVVNFVYNSTMISEQGYIIMVALALPCIYYKGKIKERKGISV